MGSWVRVPSRHQKAPVLYGFLNSPTQTTTQNAQLGSMGSWLRINRQKITEHGTYCRRRPTVTSRPARPALITQNRLGRVVAAVASAPRPCPANARLHHRHHRHRASSRATGWRVGSGQDTTLARAQGRPPAFERLPRPCLSQCAPHECDGIAGPQINRPQETAPTHGHTPRPLWGLCYRGRSTLK